MKFLLPAIVIGLAVSTQSAAAAQGPGVVVGQAGFFAQASVGAIFGVLAAIVIFGLLKIVLQGARAR